MIGSGSGRNFFSDNVAGMSPEIMQALVDSNTGSVSSYGTDPWSERLTTRLRDIFETDVAIVPVATGTAANALALSVLCPPYRSIVCADEAHINTDECGAPEFFTGGGKLLGKPSQDGKLSAATVEAAFQRARSEGFQTSQPVAVSISQATELGTTYGLDEIHAIADIARHYEAALHMDGARFANALVSLDVSPASMTWRAGVSALSFGATKNGAMAAEAVILFGKEGAAQLNAQRKRSGHLWSKARFISAQLLAYLDDDLWLRNANHANAMATSIADAVKELPAVKLEHAVQANEVFLRMPEELANSLAEAGFRFARWNRGARGAWPLYRFVTSFWTSRQDIGDLVAMLDRQPSSLPIRGDRELQP